MELSSAQITDSFVTETAKYKTKNSRAALTGAQKKDLCQKKLNNPSFTNKELARLFHCEESTVSEILTNKEHWLNVDETSLAGRAKRRRQSDYPNIEEAMAPKLTILDAINFSVSAWDKVTSKTIMSSWRCADILPHGIFEQEMDTIPYETHETEIKIVNLIEQLPIDNPISVKNYINIDKAIDLNNNADDDTLMQQIVDTINQIEVQEEESVQSERIVTSSEALVGIESVLAYIAQKNLGVELSVVRCLTKLRRMISQNSLELARQTILDEFEFVNVE
ncbi:5379_t:CDS:2 [Paraglomus occultum]|uniref:5379_t:CDS:1 n=1 Tax=Paraglomus occultum TaxID=144539 RepID=A0A9N9DL98_9GLOM|nr:5379_t:CDS:2 [Paraglomus occultum]